jgi:topoisomerase-4 subunit A
MDASDYRDGDRGNGRVRIRARIVTESKKLLRITEVPFGVTTDKLIESIVAAADKGKIKIAKIEDNTAQNADILVHLTPGSDPDQLTQALYAFSDCEVSISPNACVIMDSKPHFMGVSEILKHNTDNTKDILKRELEIQLAELNQEWHRCSLERIFIENRLYLTIEDCETWESVIQTIDKALQPFTANLRQPVTQDDIVALTEIKIKRISKYDADKAAQNLLKLEEGIAQTEKNLGQLTRYTIRWFESLKKKYGANFPRKTEIAEFGTVDRAQVAAANETLYIDDDGFAGYAVKKGNPICKCSTLDDVLIVDADGVLRVVRIQEKFFAGKNPLYINILKKDDDPVFNLMYRDGRNGPLYAKRFKIGGFTRDKEYPLTQQTKGTRIFHFSVHPTEEDSAALSVNVYLKAVLKLRNLVRVYSFGDLRIKNRNAQGNIVIKHQVDRVSRIINKPQDPTPDAPSDSQDAPTTSTPDSSTNPTQDTPNPEPPPQLTQGSLSI